MSDLQDALNQHAEDELHMRLDQWETIVEAARKYANPDIDTMRRTVIVAGIELQNQERNITWSEWANELLAALSVTEDV